MKSNPKFIEKARKGFRVLFRRAFGIPNIKKIAENLMHLSEDLEKTFGSLLNKIYMIDEKRKIIENDINDDNTFLSRHPDIQLILFIQDVYRKSFRDPILFLRNMRTQKEQIRQNFQGELAEFVLRQLERTERKFGPEERIGILFQLWGEVDSKEVTKDRVVGFIKTPPHQQDIRTAINGMTNSKTANRIRTAITNLTNEEMEYLIRYHGEVKSWENSEFMTKNIEFFQIAANNILYSMSAQHPGLVSIFTDEKLKKMLAASHAFLLLTRYNLMLLYLKNLKDSIEKNLEVGFEVVKARNAQKIYDTLVNQFGNAEAASDFFREIQFKKKFLRRGKAERQYPAELLKFFEQTIAKVSLIQYQRTKVIEPFMMEMDRILNIRISQLSGGITGPVENLKYALMPLIKSEMSSATRILAQAVRIKERIKRKIDYLRIEFEYLSDRCIDALYEIIEAKSRIFDLGLHKQILPHAKKALESSTQASKFGNYALRIANVGNADLEVDLLEPSTRDAMFFAESQEYRGSMASTYELLSVAQLLTKSDTKSLIINFNVVIKVAEERYDELNMFIEKNLKFLLIKQSFEQTRRKQNGGPRAA